jgi:hypothetical protein
VWLWRQEKLGWTPGQGGRRKGPEKKEAGGCKVLGQGSRREDRRAEVPEGKGEDKRAQWCRAGKQAGVR